MTITLYQTAGACSLAPLIALHATRTPHDIIEVDVLAHKLADGSDYYAVNPKGSVPALRTPEGDLITEVAVLLQYISELAPDANLIPTSGISRLRELELINFVATEVHKGFPPPKVFFPDYPIEAWTIAADRFRSKIDYLANVLGDKKFLSGSELKASDVYLYTILRSACRYGFDFTRWPAIISYLQRIPSHPAVAAALREEGLED